MAKKMHDPDDYDDDDVPAADKTHSELLFDALTNHPGYHDGSISESVYKKKLRELDDSRRENKSLLDEFPDVDEDGNKIKRVMPGRGPKPPGKS